MAIVISGALHPGYLLPVGAAVLIGAASIFYDYFSISRKVVLLFQIAAILMMFQFLPVFIIMPWWAIIILCAFVVVVINAICFVKAPISLSSLYSLIVLGGMQYVNINVFNFVERDLIWLPMIACAVILVLNLSKKINYSSGEVGSVTMSFWIMFLLLRLMLDSGNLAYILFLAFYGLGFVWKAISRSN